MSAIAMRIRPPVDAGAVEADEDAQIDGSPRRAAGQTIGTPPVVFLLEQQRQHALVLLILRLADGILAVAHVAALFKSDAPSVRRGCGLSSSVGGAGPQPTLSAMGFTWHSVVLKLLKVRRYRTP